MRNRAALTILFHVGLPALSLAGALASQVVVTPPQTSFLLLAADTPSAISADRAFLESLAIKDKTVTPQLLHPDFSWIDSRGKRLTRAEFLETVPGVTNGDVIVQQRVFGNVAVIRADLGQVHVMRIWVKNDSRWQIILYQEVTQVEKSESAGGVASDECDNPCKSIPFQPQTQSEKEAVASWKGVMNAIASNDADAYAPLIAEEFTATDTYHDRPYTKTDRLAQIEKQKIRGARSAPPELLSAQMFDFGETVMMIAREQRKGAKAYFNTRMWVKRDARWQMLFSFNTRIE